jgi:hypothetical protein
VKILLSRRGDCCGRDRRPLPATTTSADGAVQAANRGLRATVGMSEQAHDWMAVGQKRVRLLANVSNWVTTGPVAASTFFDRDQEGENGEEGGEDLAHWRRVR